jgi:hypothetical protein
MRLPFPQLIGLASTALFVACSSTSDTPPSSTAGAGGQLSAGGGGASAGASVAGAPNAGAPNAGSSGSPASGGGGGSAGAPASAGAGGSSGGSAGGGGGSGGATVQMNFTCTEYLGLLTTNEWYSQGFEMGGVDGAKWELKYHHFGYVNTWADPNSAFWGTTGNSFDLNQGSPLQSPCTTSPEAPDRMVYAALDWEMPDEATWVTALEKALVTFKGKYPSLRWIDIMTMIRCPGNSKCNPNANYGPGANAVANRQDCYVPSYEDSAIAKVAANHPDFVGVGPKTEADACRNPVDGAHLSADTNKKAAQAIATYYAAHP